MRRPLETVSRTIGVGALALALALSLRAPAFVAPIAPRALSAGALADSSGIGAARELSRLLMDQGQRDGVEGDNRTGRGDGSVHLTAHMTVQHVPPEQVRATLAAATLAGVSLGWTDSSGARGLVLAANAVADPQGGTIARARADVQAPLVMRDAASTLDSVATAPRGLVVSGARLSGRIEASVGRSRAEVAVPEPALMRRVLLFARPGWEAKFVTAALEERGWNVDGRLLIARNAFVTTGVPLVADTSRYAAAIVLDSGVVTADALSRFVRQGGGLVLAGDALLGTALRALQPAALDGQRPLVLGALLTDAPRRGLDAWELRPQPNSVVLARESHGTHSDPTVVVRRVGNGRVLASAYRESWRWRMEGPADGIDAHRAWWSALVSAVAFVPMPATRDVKRSAWPGDAAPYADLVARLGAPIALPTVRARSEISADAWWRATWLWFAVAAVALLVEWRARRVRGAP